MDITELGFRNGYWAHVRECLVQFHKVAPNKAKQIIAEYQKRFPIESEKPEIELVYHFEPFRLACKITGKKLSVKDFAAEYNQILKTASVVSKQPRSRETDLIACGTFGDESTIRERRSEKGASSSRPVKIAGKKAATAKKASGAKAASSAKKPPRVNKASSASKATSKLGVKRKAAAGSGSKKKPGGKKGKSAKL